MNTNAMTLTNLIRLLVTLCFLSLGPLVLSAQTRQVTLTWNHQADPPLVSFNIYRLADVCPSSPPVTPPPAPWVKANSTPITAKTFADTVQYGTYCYLATAFSAGLESPGSNSAAAVAPPRAPTGLQPVVVTAQVTVSPDGTVTANTRIETSGRVVEFTGQ